MSVMGMHKLDGGVRVRLPDPAGGSQRPGPANTPLADYYDEKGEAPGVWLGSGLVGIDGLNAGAW